MQSGVNAYILPSVKCDFQLTDSQMGVLNALFLGGTVLDPPHTGSTFLNAEARCAKNSVVGFVTRGNVAARLAHGTFCVDDCRL